MQANDPLLILDTGVGGLSVLEPIRKLLPHAPIVFAMDHEGFPYGQKSEGELTARVPALLGRLVEHCEARLAVIACNTASVVALGPVRAALHVPIVGTVPAIKPAAALSSSRVMGVLGTASTVRQPYVDKLADEFAADCTIIRHGSHELVELAEAKLRGEPTESSAYRTILEGLFRQSDGEKIDTIVLACTHFPLVEAELAAASPQPVTFVHGGDGIARRVQSLTEGQSWPMETPAGTCLSIGEGPFPAALRASLRRYGIENFEKL